MSEQIENKSPSLSRLTHNSSSHSNEEVALLAARLALEKKATNPVVLDLRNVGAFSEFFTIVSVANSRQAVAVAEDVVSFFKSQMGLRPVAVDGIETGTWVLIDYGFLFIHIFQEDVRQKYQLEQLWSKARMLPCMDA